jgi:hypothetical protein
MASLVRLDAVLAELASYAAAGWPARPSRLTCLATSPGPRTATTEVLTPLTPQWPTDHTTTAPTHPPPMTITDARTSISGGPGASEPRDWSAMIRFSETNRSY